jgi:osmotically-inducible protein OsmY
MRSDSDIKQDVEAELRYEPDLDATDITVSVKNGVVTLSGFAKSYLQKYKAETVAKRVDGVVGVANEIEVRLPGIDERPDPEIAREATANLRLLLPYSSEHIKVVVNDGWLTLEGEVEWNFQRDYAEQAVRRIKGVKGITNLIHLKPQTKPKPEPEQIKRKIEEAFRRSAELDANRITVEATGSAVVLKGTVRSWAERTEAERVAWSAPGVTKVDNRIVVQP